MSRKKKPRKPISKRSVMRAQEALNKLYRRTRPQGQRIPAEREEIEPDRGERL